MMNDILNKLTYGTHTFTKHTHFQDKLNTNLCNSNTIYRH